MQNMSVARRRRERTDSGEYSDASYEEEEQINSAEEDEGESEYDSAEHTGSDDLSERESGDGQAAPGSQKEVDHDEDRRNPQYIPKRGTFYEHDDRTALGEEEGKVEEESETVTKGTNVSGDVIKVLGAVKDKSNVTGTPSSGLERKPKQSRASAADKWTHDKFNENDQAPKSSEELVSIYGYDIRGEEGPPRAFRRRKYGRGPNKYTRNWEDEQAYGAKITPIKGKVPPQVANGEEFPSLQSSNERNKGDRRRNGAPHNIPKKTVEVVTPKKQEIDKNANNTKVSSTHSTPTDHHATPSTTSSKPNESVTIPKPRPAGTGRVGFVAPTALRRPYAEAKEPTLTSIPKETPTAIQKISVPPSAGLPSASLGGTQEKKATSLRKPNAAIGPMPRMQISQQPIVSNQQAAQPAVVASQQPQQLSSASANNNAVSQANARASPPQQISNVQPQLTTQQSTEVASGRGKRYSSIRQRPMPDQYQPVQYITDYQPTPQQAQQSAPQQQQLPAAMSAMPHRQTPPPSIQQTQQQQFLQTQQIQQMHQKTPPPQQLHLQNTIQQVMQPPQAIHQANPNLIQSTQSMHQTQQQLHQINAPIQQLHQVSPTLHQSSTSVHQTNPPQMLQANAPIHQTSPSIHQANQTILQSTPALHQPTPSMIQGQQIHPQSTTLHQSHQSNPTLHQSNQPIIQNNPPIHQVSPPLQTQMGRPATGPAVSTIPLRQVQRTHQQMPPIHNIPAPTHMQPTIPQQSLVTSQTYPTPPMIPQTQYIQNSSTNIYSHNIPSPVYQAQPGYAAPPPPLPYHHQPAPSYPARSVYREPSGITFYSPQEQKGALAPPPIRRPTNAIPIVPPPSRRDRERLSDAAAVQKDNIDHIVDNMFVPRHQQPRNAPQRLTDVVKTTEPITPPLEVAVEEKAKDGSGDKSIVEPITEVPTEEYQQQVLESKDVRLTPDSLASEVDEKLTLEGSSEPEQQIPQEDEYADCESQPIEEMDAAAETLVSDSNTIQSSTDECQPVDETKDRVEFDTSSEDVWAEVHSVDESKETIDDTTGTQSIPVVEEQITTVVEAEATTEEVEVEAPKEISVVDAEVKSESLAAETEEKSSVETVSL